MMKQMTQAMEVMMKQHLKLNEYPSYPHTSGRMGAMAMDSPIGVGVFVVVVVACMSFFGIGVSFFGIVVCVLVKCVVGGGWLLST